VVIINRAKILSRYRKHISYVFPKISRSLELLRASCKSFCVQVPIWGDFKEVAKSLFYEVKWAEILKEGSRHNCSCFSKITNWSKVICEWCSFAKLLWWKFVLRRHQNKFLKWSKYNLGELEGRSLKIGKCKYIIKTFIQKCGM